MLLYSSEHLYAVFFPGSSRHLVITFGYNGMKADDENFWGRGLCLQAGYNAVGFVTREPSWFAEAHMQPAIEQALPHIQKFTSRIVYAGSMGGYGALKYGRRLGADTALVYVPQFTLNPKLIDQFDKKFIEFFNAELHEGMEPTAADIPEKTYFLYDSKNSIDAGHAALYKAAAPHINMINMPHTNHATARVFASVPKATKLIEAAVAKDLLSVRRFAAESRRVSPLRAFLMCKDAHLRHPVWAAEIAAKHGDRFDHQDRIAMHAQMANLIRQYSERVEPAMKAAADRILTAARAAIAISADDPSKLLREAGILGRAGNRIDAIKLTRQAITAAPRYGAAYHVLAAWLLAEEDFEGAATAARRAADLDPEDATFHQRAAVAESKCGLHKDAIAAARRAVSCDPSNAKYRDFLAALYQRDGQLEEAIRTLLTSVSLDGTDLVRHKNLAAIAEKAKHYNVVCSSAEAALAIKPNDPEAVAMLKRAKEAMSFSS